MARRPSPQPRRGRHVLITPRRTPPPINGFNPITIISPHSGVTLRDRTPPVSFRASSVNGTPVDVQIEWRKQLPPVGSPIPPATRTYYMSGLTSGSVSLHEPPENLDYTRWYYRMRAGNQTTNLWGPWSDAMLWLDIQAVLGSVVEYLTLNVGVEAHMPAKVPDLSAVEYITQNVGVATADKLVVSDGIEYLSLNVGNNAKWEKTALYIDLNVGLKTELKDGAIYADLNVVTDQTPTPHIWWIRPEQGKEGYVFNLYGSGFGAFQNEYNGEVRIGDLVCSITRWEKVPAQLLTSTVRVSGRPRPSVSTTTLPYVLLSTGSRVVQEGDIIEYDMKWEAPANTLLDIFPIFTTTGYNSPVGLGYALADTTGDAWVSDQPESYGAWHHRKFVVPADHTMIGRTISNFGIAWYGADASTPIRTASIRSMVVRQADGTPVLWITGDDQNSTPALTYVANAGELVSSAFDQDGHVIERGTSLDPDVITPEHGWIVAIVPSGATSSMISVALEDN